MWCLCGALVVPWLCLCCCLVVALLLPFCLGGALVPWWVPWLFVVALLLPWLCFDCALVPWLWLWPCSPRPWPLRPRNFVAITSLGSLARPWLAGSLAYGRFGLACLGLGWLACGHFGLACLGLGRLVGWLAGTFGLACLGHGWLARGTFGLASALAGGLVGSRALLALPLPRLARWLARGHLSRPLPRPRLAGLLPRPNRGTKVHVLASPLVGRLASSRAPSALAGWLARGHLAAFVPGAATGRPRTPRALGRPLPPILVPLDLHAFVDHSTKNRLKTPTLGSSAGDGKECPHFKQCNGCWCYSCESSLAL